MQLLARLNPENVTIAVSDTYPVREAARAVIVDEEGNVALLHVTRDRYYKLPGGGVESGEDKLEALQRECLEEIGCQVSIESELGMIIEERGFCQLRQISYCYIARQKGLKSVPNFTQEEKEEGFEVLWIPYQTARDLMAKNEAVGIEGSQYITPRDRIFLKAAENILY